jgi:hypothetical protein
LKQSVTMRVQIRASGTREHENQSSSSITKKQLLVNLSDHAEDFQCRCRHASILKMVPIRHDDPEALKLERIS